MRFSLPLIALGALVVQVAGRATSLTRRTFTDVCADVSADLAVPGLFGQSINFGLLNICICISGLDALLSSNPLVIAAVAFAGTATVKAEITKMINAAAGGEVCTFPDNAVSFCSKGTPCGFSCKNGFSPSSDKKECVCLPPFSVCNGVCGKFKSCPSSHPKSKREIELDIQKREAVCDKGLTACGIYGWNGLSSKDAWECVDTNGDIESCGGCAIPLTLGTPRGIDCTAIPGVRDVSCHAGQCIVHRCSAGYIVSLDRTFCVRKSNAMGGMKANGDMPAGAYGLEHVPLKKRSE